MKLELKRHTRRQDCTSGHLFIDGHFFCHTLEDPWRKDPQPETPENEAKVWGDTCIPAGTYRVILNMSPRFKKIMPRLLDVPGFTGILIHSGNTPADTHGCILVGQEVDNKGHIVRGKSSPAYIALLARIDTGTKQGPLTITITDGFDV